MNTQRISRKQATEPNNQVPEQSETANAQLAVLTQAILNGIAPVTRDTRRKLSMYL